MVSFCVFKDIIIINSLFNLYLIYIFIYTSVSEIQCLDDGANSLS